MYVMDTIEENIICCIKGCIDNAEYNYKFLYIPAYCEKHKNEKMQNLFKICIICQNKYKIYEHCKHCSEFELLCKNKVKNI